MLERQVSIMYRMWTLKLDKHKFEMTLLLSSCVTLGFEPQFLYLIE
jgi:hypothetical protein